MNREDLIRRCREDLLDDVSDAPDQDDEGYLWSAAFLSRALADAEYEACRRADLLFDETTAAICEVTLVSGTSLYALDDRIIRIDRVRYEGETLRHRTEHEMDRIHGEAWRTDTGEPEEYIIKGRKIRIFPIPTDDEDSDTVTLEVYRLPLVRFKTEPEIPEEYHRDLCYWAAHMAYKRRDEDTYDPRKAAEMLAEFNTVFGPPVSAKVREHQFTQPRKARYFFDKAYGVRRHRGDALEEDCW